MPNVDSCAIKSIKIPESYTPPKAQAGQRIDLLNPCLVHFHGQLIGFPVRKCIRNFLWLRSIACKLYVKPNQSIAPDDLVLDDEEESR
jgi:hypothetical protein